VPTTDRHLATPVDDVVDRVRAGRADVADLDRVVALLRAVQHAGYDSRWRASRRAFAVSEPDAVLDELREVLESANYTEVPREVLLRALGESAVSRVKVQVALDSFAELVFFRRRSVASSAAVGRYRGWRAREVVHFEAYDRVAMYARLQDAAWFESRGRALDELPLPPGSAHVKLFQDVPEPDMEMLVPGIEVTMRTVDKVVLGVPALISGIVVAVTKLGAALVLATLLVAASLGLRDESPEIDTGTLVTLLGGAIALGGYLWRQWSKIKTRRVDYLRRLSESLYLKTIADGPRVLFALLDAAEEQDLAEVLLAYRALLDGPAGPGEVAERARAWLDPGERVEIPEALSHLEALGLASRHGGSGEGWQALAPAQAVQALRVRWQEIGDELAGAPQP
jgi:hypothetical protein